MFPDGLFPPPLFSPSLFPRGPAVPPTPAGWKSVFQMRWGGGACGGAAVSTQTAWKTIAVGGRPTDGVSIIGRPPNR